MTSGSEQDAAIVDVPREDITVRHDATGTVIEWPAVEGATGYRVDADALDARVAAELGQPAAPLPFPERWERRCDTAFDGRLPPGAEELLAQWSAAMAPARQACAELVAAIAPAIAAMGETLRWLAEDHPELLALPRPQDARERALAAKRAPGRTGPPAPRLDGRRGRR